MKYLKSYFNMNMNENKIKINKERKILDKQLKTMEEKSKTFNEIVNIIKSSIDDPSQPEEIIEKYYDIKILLFKSLEEIKRLKSFYKNS